MSVESIEIFTPDIGHLGLLSFLLISQARVLSIMLIFLWCKAENSGPILCAALTPSEIRRASSGPTSTSSSHSVPVNEVL